MGRDETTKPPQSAAPQQAQQETSHSDKDKSDDQPIITDYASL